MTVISRETGQPPTEQEQQQIDTHAIKVLSSPYSAPEQVAWAVDCGSPAVIEDWFFTRWDSSQQIGRRQRGLERPTLTPPVEVAERTE